jgi:hypothetical protein
VAVNSQAPVQPSPAAAPTEHTPAVPVDQTAATPPSIEAPEQAPVGRDWFRDSMNAVRGIRTGIEDPAPRPETPPASEPKPETAPGAQKEQAKPSAETKDGTPPQTPQARVYTEAEIARMVQAETDRRLDKHNREEAERRRRAAADAEIEEERELRRKDPYGYARKMEQKEIESQALQQQLRVAQTHVQQLGVDFDRTVVDPIVTAVPAALRSALLQNVGEGLDGRGALVQGALKALEKHWREQGFTEARKRLASDQGFVKEILTRYGGQRPEPDSIPSTGTAPGAPVNMNDRLRMMAGRR